MTPNRLVYVVLAQIDDCDCGMKDHTHVIAVLGSEVAAMNLAKEWDGHMECLPFNAQGKARISRIG
jgi:hypothetical protein